MSKLTTSLIFLATGFGLASSAQAQLACQEVITGKPSSYEMKQKELKAWRNSPNKKQSNDYMALTNPSQTGYKPRTNADRERGLQLECLSIKKEVLINDIQAIGFALYPEVGVREKVLEDAGDYGTHKTQLLKISNLGPSGVLPATMVLPVSGRYGRETTLKWATTDLYSLYLTSPEGVQSTLINGAHSLNVTTMQEINIPLVKGQIVSVSYNRHGSAGPAGFPEGRIVRLLWDGT